MQGAPDTWQVAALQAVLDETVVVVRLEAQQEGDVLHVVLYLCVQPTWPSVRKVCSRDSAQ